MRRLLFAIVVVAGCTRPNPSASNGGAPPGSGGPIPVADAGVGGGGATPDLGAIASPDLSAPPPVASCYSEVYTPTISLADLAASYSPQQWRAVVLETLNRRIQGGHYLVEAQQNDPQLGNGVDASSWPALMGSIYDVCNGATTDYDFGHATASTFVLYMHVDLIVTPPKLQTFGRGEILAYITDDATRTYDQTYLQGAAGQDDLTFLADDVASFENALGCSTAVADQLPGGISARDGVAASLYYLELYLKRARLAHPSVYAALQASADWQRFVRFAWARGAFWRAQATDANLGVADAPIWAHVDDPTNSAEIVTFTGRQLPDIVCHP